jgi:hypothetical protein
MRKQYSLKWTSGNEGIAAMERFFNPDLSLEAMTTKVRKMIAILPESMALVVKHALLTGLRPSEAVESVKLIQNSETFPHYYDASSMTLCHYKFPKQFIRATKKAYLSYITLDNLQPIREIESCTPTYTAIRLACRRRGVNMDMHLTRKLFASWLIQVGGIDSNTVDLLRPDADVGIGTPLSKSQFITTFQSFGYR